MKNKGLKQFGLIIFLMIGFLPNLFGVTTFNFNRMNLSLNFPPSSVLPLRNLNSNINSSQVRSVMGVFFAAGTQHYGYYTIRLSARRAGRGPRDNARTAAFIIAGSLTLGATTLFLPMGQFRYELTASIALYDINRERVDAFSATRIVYLSEHTIRSRNDHSFRVDGYFRNLLWFCLNAASVNASNINQLLMDAKHTRLPVSTVVSYAYNELRSRIPPCSVRPNTRIAIINANSDPDVAAAINHLEHHFLYSNCLVDRRTINLIMAELNFSNSIFADEARRIGRLLSANYLLIVDTAGQGNNRELNFRAVYVETGRVVANFSSRFQS